MPARPRRTPGRHTASVLGLAAALAAVSVLIAGGFLLSLAASARSTDTACPNGAAAGAQSSQTDPANTDIPAGYLRLYQEAGQRYGINWALLAGIGKVESDHGRSRLP